jgi:hypothetical protein
LAREVGKEEEEKEQKEEAEEMYTIPMKLLVR